jgi:RHS repeat-associated protein
VTYPNGDIQSYTYDPMGNRLTKVHNGATTNYTTDDADQMTAAGGVAYGYDNNGNQTSRGADTFTYNTENRLTATNLAGTAGSYAYNGDGLRTSRMVGATTSTFAWGNATGMPVILRDSAGNRYLYGRDLISVSDSANKKFYYHTDGLGSTTAITGSTGAVVKTYQYDAYGSVRSQTGTQPNEFTFTGEQVDTSGLQYLRARYYDSGTGRFANRDPLPLMQRYAYVGNNAPNLVDPTGLCGVSISPSNAADCLGVGAEKLAQVADYAEGAIKAATPYAKECGIWAVGGAIAGGWAGAAAGCATGVVSYAWAHHVSDDPISQCIIWGLGAATSVGRTATAAVFNSARNWGCGAAILSWVDSKFGVNSVSTQCTDWGVPGLKAGIAAGPLPAGLAFVGGCVSGGAERLISSGG